MRVEIYNNEIFIPEPVGKQPKYWFQSYGQSYLFKEATYKQDGSPIYNDVSECMAADLGRFLGIPMAEYYLCIKNGVKGVISKDFLANEGDHDSFKKEELYDGVTLIQNIDPNFKNKSLINPQTHQYYTVDLVIQSVLEYGLMKDALNMIVFDALIGNRDRNPSNYGVIINHETGKIRFSPLYDSCASLGVSMVNHRLAKCFDIDGKIVDLEHLNIVVHKHIIGKVTLDRFLQYKDKRAWDLEESKRILSLIEQRRSELLPLLGDNKISREQYHKELNKVGNGYRKFDVSTVQYQTLIGYLTNYYPGEIEDIMGKISLLNEGIVNKIFDYYKDELPIDRLNMAKKIVLERSKWMTDYYYTKRFENRGKLL